MSIRGISIQVMVMMLFTTMIFKIDNSVPTYVEASRVSQIDLFTGESYDILPLESSEQDERKSTEYLVQVEQLIVEQINKERKQQGLTAYEHNDKLQRYAREKSRDMAINQYFSHEDLNGKNIVDQMKQDGLTFTMWGENIGSVTGTTDSKKIAEELINVWLNSEGHRANILSKEFNELGAGVYEKDGKVYATLEFTAK